MEKLRAELALFSIKKARVTSDAIFIVCTLIDNQRGHFDSYCNNIMVLQSSHRVPPPVCN